MAKLDLKNPVTVGLIAVLVVMIALAAFGPNISGRVASTPVSMVLVELPWAVTTTGTQTERKSHWGICDKFEVGREGAAQFCRDEGFSDVAPAIKRPCRYGSHGTTYGWDGVSPLWKTTTDIGGPLEMRVGWEAVLCVV